MKVLFATTNPAKIKKYAEKLKENNIEVLTIKDLGINLKPEETGKNAIENAYIKAKAYYDKTKITTIGMDNNLYIEELPQEKQPGTHVRRVNGKELNDDEMIEYYCNLVQEYGGKLTAKWVYGMVIYDGKESKEQYDRFMQCIKELKNNGIKAEMLHMCNSSAFLRFPEMHLNAVRVGSALLGRLSIPNTWGFKKVGYLKSNVAEIKTIPTGYNIGYSNSYTTKKETKIAIIPCGYADGFNVVVDRDMFRPIDKLRYIVRDTKDAFKNKKIYVTINGKKCEVLGRLGMFHVSVDITGQDIKIGDDVQFNVIPMFVDSSLIRVYE